MSRFTRDEVTELALQVPGERDERNPLSVVVAAIDRGGGQTTNIHGVLTALFAMPPEVRRWLAEQLHPPRA